MQSTESDKEISKLPEKRKKISFKIGGGKNETDMTFGVDLKSGICNWGRRISCQIYDVDRDSYIVTGDKFDWLTSFDLCRFCLRLK
ncbi:unnamed protein product [Lactuca virosa]|uniref:Uncharacterized protein n=1 Tax=Lactuca virosa TaxID=75947 RepID=A0AAU9LZK7_9ASTR|nr:unnamed protein product [Lactuca virosa]